MSDGYQTSPCSVTIEFVELGQVEIVMYIINQQQDIAITQY